MSNIVIFDPQCLSGSAHVVLGVPQELEYKANDAGGKGVWHSIPIRSRVVTSNDTTPLVHYNKAEDSPNVAIGDGTRNAVRGLKRLGIRLRDVWVSRISSFGDQEGQGDDNKVQMSISMTGLHGATDEEQEVINALDGLTSFIRRTMVQCRDIRTPLKIAPGLSISDDNVDSIAAGVLDSVQICRSSDPTRGEVRRYMYPKVNLQSGFFRTQLFTPTGKPIPIAAARAWSSGTTAKDVIVELESVTCTKLVKTVRMRVLEAILEPPASRDSFTTRSSLLFPDLVIPPHEADEGEDQDQEQTCNLKRKREDTEDTVSNSSE